MSYEREWRRIERSSRKAERRIDRQIKRAEKKLDRDYRKGERAYNRLFKDSFGQRVLRLFTRRQLGQDFDGSGFGSIFGEDFGFDAFNGVQGQAAHTETGDVSPAEADRRRLMSSLSLDKTKTLATFEEANVRNFIATVHQAREVNPERTDWSIYVSYRKSIEVENPDPAMVEKTQIAGLLLDGTREKAHFPF